MAQLMARTWRFNLTLRIGALSDSYEVCNTFKEILDAALARLEMRGLEYSRYFIVFLQCAGRRSCTDFWVCGCQ